MTLPTGTVTFLRSDIEGSMALARALGTRYDELNAEHAAIMRSAIEDQGGEVVRTEGDAFFAVFTDAGAAARAAVDIQRRMNEHDWPDGHELRVRIGLHSGTAVHAGDDYGGFEVNRAARIGDAGHGGQIVVSDAARALIALDLPDRAELIDLGRHRLKGVPQPEYLYQLIAPGLVSDFEALRTAVDASDHLPDRHASFVGREAELTALEGLLAGTRLLTLVGPGGTGKTTLAIELARRHAADYADGAWFVDLQAVTDPSRVKAEVARGLGLFDGPSGPAAERLLPYLTDRASLVVIDNFEQVVEAAEVVTELLTASSESRVIVTSRIPLRLAAEQEYPVRPLDLAGDGDGVSEAVRLFLERARKGRPDFDLHDGQTEAIERVCELVDGLPLAIELCAARVKVLPIERIHERLAQHLPLPGSGPRELPERQRTIEGTVEWSLGLLDETHRRLFTRLGVFGTSFELEQAEAVCAGLDVDLDVLDGLAGLVEQSLLLRLDDHVGGVRFGMIGPVRLVARARFEHGDDAEAVRARHAHAYLALADRIFPWHHEPAVSTWVDRLEADDDNLRLALAWSIESGAVTEALSLVGNLWKYWVHSGRLAAGRRYAEQALAVPGADAASEARVWAVSAAGSLAYWSKDIEQTIARYEEQLALAQELGYRLGEANACFNLIFVRRGLGDMEGAHAAAADAKRILTELGAITVLEDIDAALAITSAQAVLVDPERYLPVMAQQIERLEQASSPHAQAALPAIRSLYYFVRGDGPRAAAEQVSALRLDLAWRRMGDVITALSFVAVVGIGRLPPDVLATLLGGVESAILRYGVTGPSWDDIIPALPPDPMAELSTQLGPEQLQLALETGRQMTLAELVDYLEANADSFTLA